MTPLALRMHVLLVEGHAGVRTMLAARLRLAPQVAAVTTAATLERAVQVAQAWPPDVVLYEPRTVTTRGTAGVDGATGVRILALLGRPVVVLTTSLVAGEGEMLAQCGAAAILLKGQPLPVLLFALRTALAAQPAGGAQRAARTTDDPRRWRALALLDQLRVAVPRPGTAVAPRTDRAAALVTAAAPASPAPSVLGRVAVQSLANAVVRTRLHAEMARAARLIAQAEQLLARSHELCARAQAAHRPRPIQLS